MRKYNERKICIICEGFEECDYLQALIDSSVFSKLYKFVLVNAKSINKIMPQYQAKFQSDYYSLVLIFCDTDKGPSKKYLELKQKINDFHGNDIANNIIIFGNPCTMQIILSHFAKIKLTSQSKNINARFIEQYIGIEDYKASEDQRKELFSKIKKDNYYVMKENVRQLSSRDEDVSSTNFLKFAEKFETDDTNWLNEINEKL